MATTNLRLTDLKAAGRTVIENSAASLIDMGEGVACLEYHTKMNTFNPDLTAFLYEAQAVAERDFRAMVIGNNAPHFSVGYNLHLFLEGQAAGDYAALERNIRELQFAFQQWKYSSVPVVSAPHAYSLGAGTEGSIHCAAIVAAPDAVLGLPELRIGIIAGAGGTKEMLARAMQGWRLGEPLAERIRPLFDLLALHPRNSADAEDARTLGFLRPTDRIAAATDTLLTEAKNYALELAERGYRPPSENQIWVGGSDVRVRLQTDLLTAHERGDVTDYDTVVANQIVNILCGGDIPYPQYVSEEYLMQLERDAFHALIDEPLTQARLRHVLATGQHLRN